MQKGRSIAIDLSNSNSNITKRNHEFGRRYSEFRHHSVCILMLSRPQGNSYFAKLSGQTTIRKREVHARTSCPVSMSDRTAEQPDAVGSSHVLKYKLHFILRLVKCDFLVLLGLLDSSAGSPLRCTLASIPSFCSHRRLFSVCCSFTSNLSFLSAALHLCTLPANCSSTVARVSRVPSAVWRPPVDVIQQRTPVPF
jgi:hypothetical protein